MTAQFADFDLDRISEHRLGDEPHAVEHVAVFTDTAVFHFDDAIEVTESYVDTCPRRDHVGCWHFDERPFEGEVTNHRRGADFLLLQEAFAFEANVTAHWKTIPRLVAGK